MKSSKILVGASERIITPPVGTRLSGWSSRAAGDNVSRFVHDDLYVKTLCVEGETGAWGIVSADLVGIDPVAVVTIRDNVYAKTGLLPESLLCSATHCHSGPVVMHIALACSVEDLKNCCVDTDGNIVYDWSSIAVKPDVGYKGQINWEWREFFIQQASGALVDAWESRKPAKLAYGETDIEGVASSRRVLLKDGTWADPRKDSNVEDQVVSRTRIDPLVRNVFVKDADTDDMIAVLVNYGSHPWLFSISGFSAEIPGALSKKLEVKFAGNQNKPIILNTAGPEGDVSTIWNLDIPNLWKINDNESKEESLKRREKVFGQELDRLSDIMLRGVIQAYEKRNPWKAEVEIRSYRKEISLPLKTGYSHPSEILLADWQKKASPAEHLTEVQLLKLGEIGILSLPGEPFASIGMSIREKSSISPLIITALGNEIGGIHYIPDQRAFDLGGYELVINPLAKGCGEKLIDSVDLFLRGFSRH